MNTKERSLTARDWLGSAVMLSFTLIAIQRWDSTGSVFFLLLAADNLVKSFYFYTRSEAIARGSSFQSAVAYVSAALPLLYLRASDDVSSLVSTSAQLLMISGFLLVALATIDLGESLGLSPARRSRAVTSGTYRIFGHPMYFGHSVAELGLVIINPANALLFCASLLLYGVRIRFEENILRQPISHP